MKRHKLKSIFAVFLAILLCFALFGCGGSGDNEKSEEPANPNKIGNYEVTIDNCELTTDWEGKDAVQVKFTFTNNSDEAADFLTAAIATVYQDGVELDTSFTDDSDDNESTSIKKGKSIEVSKVYLLKDKKNPIEVEVSEFLGTTDEKVTKTFDIK